RVLRGEKALKAFRRSRWLCGDRRVAARRGLGNETALLDQRIEPRQSALERLGLVGDLELEERLLLDELARALGVLNAGNLHDDAIVTLLLDDRFGNAEAVDTRANRLQRALDGLGPLVRSDGLLGVVDLEREVCTTLEVEAALQRNATTRYIVQESIGAA